MITKAIIEQIINQYEVRVRIPVYNKSADAVNCTPTDQLYIASTCIPAGQSYNYNVGDVVYVGFEDNDVSKPVILGFLYNSNDLSSTSDYQIRNLYVDSEAVLPKYTNIGSITGSEINTLSGQTRNISGQFETSISIDNNYVAANIVESHLATYDSESQTEDDWNYHIYDDDSVIMWRIWRLNPIPEISTPILGGYTSEITGDDSRFKIELPLLLKPGTVVAGHVSRGCWLSNTWVSTEQNATKSTLNYSIASSKIVQSANDNIDIRMILIGKLA